MAPNEIKKLTGLTLEPHAIRDRLHNLIEEGKSTKSGVARGTLYKIVKTHAAKIHIQFPKSKVEGHGEGISNKPTCYPIEVPSCVSGTSARNRLTFRSLSNLT